MPLDQSRIQGFGSDGATKKIWQCPAGHMLQPSKAKPGKCDGCKKRVPKDDCVMDCRQCNWYLCQECHPQEKQEEEDWFWGSLSYIVQQAQQEVNEVAEEISVMAGDFECFIADAFATGGCTVTDGKQFEKDEIRFGDGQSAAMAGPADKKIAKKPKDKEKKRPKGISSDNYVRGPEANKAEPAESSAPAASAPSAAPERPAPPQPAQSAPPPPPHDLLDIGQDDLLDIDLDPAASSGAAQVSAPLPAMPAPPAPAASLAPPAPPAAKVAATKEAAVPASPANDLLDLDFGICQAAQSPAAATSGLEDMEFGDFAAAPASFAVPAPAAVAVAGGPADLLPDLI